MLTSAQEQVEASAKARDALARERDELQADIYKLEAKRNELNEAVAAIKARLG